jgi:dienelactone hydrolase
MSRTHSPRSVNAGFLACLLSLCGCAKTSGPAVAATPVPQTPAAPTPPAEPVAAGAPAAAADTSDEAAQRCLEALAAGDFAKARIGFDAQLLGALSADQLAAAWASQAGKLGAFSALHIQQRATHDGLDVRVLELSFEHGTIQALIAVHPDTRELAGLRFKALPASSGPAAYVQPAAFQSQDVQVGAAPFLLPGVLTLPVGKGPFPALVLVHGSGPHDRDETIGPNKPFQDLAQGLSSRGIAVLRYDKRTLRYGAQLPRPISIDDEVIVDAVSAVAVLQGQKGIDPRRVFVLGHSLGAELAPEIALRATGVAGAVLLAPSARPPWDVILEQLQYLGVPPAQRADAESAAAALRAGKSDGPDLLGVPAAYWRDLGAHTNLESGKKLERPLLILHGDRDYQVTEADIALWRSGLGGAKAVEIEELSGLNHLFMTSGNAEDAKPSPAEYDVPGHVDERVIAKIAQFVAAR